MSISALKEKFNSLTLESENHWDYRGNNNSERDYGQYSIMPLRWINYHDIDEAIDETLLATLYEIDNQSLGGKSSNKALTPARKKVVKKSETLKIQLNQINNLASQQSNKIIAFYSDYDRFLAALSRKMKSNAISVWTLGNRKVAKQEIFMDKIMIELCKPYHMQLLTNFTRQILNKRMPKLNGYQGEEKGLQSTMTREHILIFVRSDSKNEQPAHPI